MPTVWIPSLPHRYDAATQRMIPAYDVNHGAMYGELAVMVEGAIEDLGEAIEHVKSVPIRPEDYIMAIGDVVLVAVAIAHAPNGVKVLRWNKQSQTYDTVEV